MTTYENPTPVSAGIIPSTIPGFVWFIERADGGIALHSGYVDKLEDGYMAINRETKEELGIDLDVDKWQIFHTAVNKANKLLLFFHYPEAMDPPADFVPNKEVLRVFAAHWDTPLKFPYHMLALKRWAAMTGAPAKYELPAI
jgi:8-oxo-dGTP pyrophosphatase MutT (NUDIX family)